MYIRRNLRGLLCIFVFSLCLMATLSQPTWAATSAYTGWWWEGADKGGTGVSLEVRGESVYLAWFGYAADGRCEWYSSFMAKNGERYEGDLIRYTGRPLDGGDPAEGAASEIVGEAFLTLSEENTAEFVYKESGTEYTRRLSRFLDGTNDPRDLHGWWYDAEYPGMGVFLEVRGRQVFAAWYLYRADFGPQWWTTGGEFNPDMVYYYGDLHEYESGQTLTGAWQPATEAQSPGAVSLNFINDAKVCELTFGQGEYSLQRYDWTKEPLVIDSDLTLSGNRTLHYKDKDITVQAVITVQDEAALSFTDCNLTWDQEYHQQYRMFVRGNASLSLDSVYVDSKQGYWLNWEYHDNAAVNLKDVEYGLLWTSITDQASLTALNSEVGLTIHGWSTTDSGSIDFQDCPEVYLELGLPRGNHDITLPPQGNVTYWHADFMGDVKLHDSGIYKLDVDITPGVQAVLRDTAEFSVGWAMWPEGPEDQVMQSISGIRQGFYTDTKWTVADSSLRVVNSSIGKFWPTAFQEFRWTIQDCDLVDPRAWDSSQMILDNCTLHLFAAYSNAKAVISNSKIQSNVSASGNAEIRLNNITEGDEFSTTILDNAVIYKDGVPVSP